MGVIRQRTAGGLKVEPLALDWEHAARMPFMWVPLAGGVAATVNFLTGACQDHPVRRTKTMLPKAAQFQA
jgi:hypothetical protein